jgi:E3 ubiquitin-protein ligase RFWD2
MAADVPSASGFVKEEHEMGSWPPSGDQDYLDAGGSDVDKDLLCPICFQAMGDAFLSSCGHSFCYICITTHLNHKSSCPSCARYLTTEQLIPNFLLTKVRVSQQPKSSMA